MRAPSGAREPRPYAASHTTGRKPVIRTTGGLVAGLERGGVQRFAGIPYAAPPVGPARFGAPVPPPGWDGVRDAIAAGPTAPAADRGKFGGMDLRPVLGSGRVPGEDYLTVGVTTPDPAAGGLPVLVFVHGGGFVSGTGQADLYDGTSFARHGVVLVTLNYRLGVPGWLDIPGAPANRGLLDVIAALRWVADNIAAFGGDPGRVTVAGQSAGAMVVAALLAVPRADGLFGRAVSQSGNGLCAFTRDQAGLVTQQVAEALGVEPRASAFDAVDDARLTAALALVQRAGRPATGHLDPSLGGNLVRPVIDGELLRQQPALALRSRVLAGTATRTDLLVGTNTDEANLYTVPDGSITALTDDGLRAVAARRSARPAALDAAYRARLPLASPGTVASRLITDVYREGSRALADAHAGRTGSRTFAYEFAWRSDAFAGALGAAHCVELPFVFDQSGLPSLLGETALLGVSPPPGNLAPRVHAAWVSFVTDGDPGWETYDAQNRATMRIGDHWDLVRAPDSPATAGT